MATGSGVCVVTAAMMAHMAAGAQKSGPEWWMLTFPVPGAQAATAQFAEAGGWDGMVFADTQNLAAEVYGSLCLAATATTRLQLGTGVTNPVTRHPAVTAAGIATVQVASAGRAVLGIGRGDSSLAHLGRAPEAPAAFERYVRAVQQYLSGQEADLGDGVVSRSEWIDGTGRPKVPVDVAATGPKVIGIGARLAERVTFAVGAEPERVEAAIATARRARDEAGLDPVGLSLGAYVNVLADPDVERARRWSAAGSHRSPTSPACAAHRTSSSPTRRCSADSARRTSSPVTGRPRRRTRTCCRTSSSTGSAWSARRRNAPAGCASWSTSASTASSSSAAPVTRTLASCSPRTVS